MQGFMSSWNSNIMKVYLDNAATTPIAPEVVDTMVPLLRDEFGNPSSTHQFGRKAKSIIEGARRSIAKGLNCKSSEICFTSGGTEADNMAIKGSIRYLGVKRIITSPIEHHAVTRTVEECDTNKQDVKVEFVKLDEHGRPDLEDLDRMLEESDEKTLVSLMHANNEIGTITPIHKVGRICRKHQVLFHSDTVQTMGHLPIDLSKMEVDFITGAAHKFHGPKGVGFLYINKDVSFGSLIQGGGQERALRAGTENIYGIAGMAKALELALDKMEEDSQRITGIREYMKEKLQEAFPDVRFNGCPVESLYTVLNVSFPEHENGGMLLFLLDIDGIAASGGSACSSGSNVGSHVLNAIGAGDNRPSVRFSFGRFNTKEEVDYVVDKLKVHLAVPVGETAG